MLKLTTNKILFGGAVSVVAMWTTYAFLKMGYTVEKWGVFGDKFGALNTLFTGLASVGVVAALWHEREGAKERDREHRELLEAMKAQTEASQKTARVMALSYQLQNLEHIQDGVPHHAKAMGMDHDIAAKMREITEELAKISGVKYN